MLILASGGLGLAALALCVAGGQVGGLLGQKDGRYVGQHAALRDGDAGEQLVELLVVADGELEVTRVDSSLLVVARGVAGQLEDLGGQVLEHGGQVDGRAGANAVGEVALLEHTMETAHRELEAGTGRARARLHALRLA